MGVTADTHTVLYCCQPEDIWVAARVWWTFYQFGYHKVSILDGGLRKWINEGRNTVASATVFNNTNFETDRHDTAVRTRLKGTFKLVRFLWTSGCLRMFKHSKYRQSGSNI